MRNLKKILALALALVMTLSLMTTANAFSDDKDFTAEYTEAATVLSSLGCRLHWLLRQRRAREG